MRPRDGGPGVGFGALLGDRRFELKVDAEAPLKDPATYTVVGKPLRGPTCRPSATGRHRYVHDFKLPGMLHGRVDPPARRSAPSCVEVDESSIRDIPGARVIRIKDFLGVVAPDEWDADARAPRAQGALVRERDAGRASGRARLDDARDRSSATQS